MTYTDLYLRADDGSTHGTDYLNGYVERLAIWRNGLPNASLSRLIG